MASIGLSSDLGGRFGAWTMGGDDAAMRDVAASARVARAVAIDARSIGLHPASAA